MENELALKDKDTLVIDVRDVGYQVLVSHIDEFEVGQEVFVYTYNVVREDETYLVAFKTLEEKAVFLS